MAYDQTTSFLQTQVTRALLGVENTQRAIWNSATNPPSISNPGFDFVPKDLAANVKKPVFSDVFEGADSTSADVIRLNKDADEWINKYFPAIGGELLTLPEDWLVNIISGVKPFGIESTIFDMVWQKARDRATAERQSETKTMAANMSARGFSMPNGALVDLTYRMNEKLIDDVSAVNREEAIKDAEIKLDLLKFAVEQALRYKMGLMGAMADFYRVWIALPNTRIELAKARSQALESFYRALSSYYNVEIAVEELKMKAAVEKTDTTMKYYDQKIRAFAASRGDNGLGSAAQAFGHVASGAATAASSLVAQIESL